MQIFTKNINFYGPCDFLKMKTLTRVRPKSPIFWNWGEECFPVSIEEEAKVVAAVWGDRIDSIPCCTSYFGLGRFWRIEWINPFLKIILVQFNLSFNSSKCKIASAERNLINIVNQTSATPKHHPNIIFCIYPPSMALTDAKGLRFHVL